MATLLMFSGGLDSTGALVKLLSESNDTIRVHRINIKTKWQRWLPEQAASQKILSYCRENYRLFTYSESTVDLESLNLKWVDLYLVSFTAALIAAQDLSIDKIARGTVLEDRKLNQHAKRKQKSEAILQSVLPDESKAKFIFPVGDLTKQEIRNFLPADLTKYIWSCRNPIFQGQKAFACGTCHACCDADNSENRAKIKITPSSMSGLLH